MAKHVWRVAKSFEDVTLGQRKEGNHNKYYDHEDKNNGYGSSHNFISPLSSSKLVDKDRKKKGLSGYFYTLKKKLSRDSYSHLSFHSSKSMAELRTKTPNSKSNFDFNLYNGNDLQLQSQPSSMEKSVSTPQLPPRGRKKVIVTDVTGSSDCNSPIINSDTLSDSEMGNNDDGGSRDDSTSLFYSLTIHLIRGADLVIKDKSGSSDPFVKCRVGKKTLYRSKIINSNLNPIWDEVFTIPIQDINEAVIFKVCDYDFGSKDDFMGMCLANLRKLGPNQPQDFDLTLSKNGLPGEKSMGQIFVQLTLHPRTAEQQNIWMAESVASQSQMKMQKHTWNGTLTVILIDVTDLPNRRGGGGPLQTDGHTSGGYSNVFVKLRLANEKRKSKTFPELTNKPEWYEQFDFYLYEGTGQTTILEAEIFEEASTGRIPLGIANLDISLLKKDKTVEASIPFTNGLGRIRMAVTVTGFRPNVDDSASAVDCEALIAKYSLINTKKINEIRDVGTLIIKVIQAEGLRAADFGGNSDPFTVLELVNQRVQTHTEYKTLKPQWNKSYEFEVKDYTSKLEVTVYDEDRGHKIDFLGKINIPLWKIKNGEKVWYKLKNKNMAKEARGNNPQILLEMDLFWNPIRAAIRVTDPQEIKYIQPKPHLKIETFLINLERLRIIIMDVYDIWLYIKSCIDWEYPNRSIMALTIYLLTCYFFQPFFIPLFLLIFWLRSWWKNINGDIRPTISELRKNHNSIGSNNSPIRAKTDDTLDLDESDEEDEESISQLSIIKKFAILQDASGVLQELVGEVAAICESTVNTYRMAVPFIYWLFAIIFAVATIALMFIELRYIAMILGIHEFSRVYLRPWKQSTFEFYHMIRRVPHKLNMNEKIGIDSVLRSIQQLKSSSKRFWKRKKSSSPSPAVSASNSPISNSTWYGNGDNDH